MPNAMHHDIKSSPILLHIMREYGLSAHEAMRLFLRAPHKYKEYDIPKKHSAGKRHIAHPAAELKIIQRWLVQNYLSELPVHSAAMAYEVETSIRKNAEVHVRNSYLMKLDFKDFFPSIKPSDLTYFLNKHGKKFTEEDKLLLARLLFWQPKGSRKIQLSIGAPSSPAISNRVMYDFDIEISNYCTQRGIAYSRFADDLTFSTNTPDILEQCLGFVRKVIKATKSPRLKLNEDKIVFSSKKFNRRVTGLVLTNDERVSIGHQKKREIRAAVHYFIHGKLNHEECQTLRGNLAYINAVEPTFLERLSAKYGERVISDIQSYNVSV